MKITIMIFTTAACIILYAIYNIVIQLMKWGRLYKYASKFVGPTALPFIGNAHLLFGDAEAILKKVAELLKAYPSPFRLWLGSRLVFVVTTPEHIKAVLNSDKVIGRGDVIEPVRAWLGKALPFADEPEWRLSRPLLQPTFHLKNLQTFVEVFYAQALMMSERMEKHLNGPEFDIYNYLSMYSLNSICETTMGVNLGDQKIGDLYPQTVEKVLSVASKRVFDPLLRSDFIFDRTQLGKDHLKYIKYLHDFTDDVLRIKKREHLQRSHEPNGGDDEGNLNPPRKVLLQNLIELSRDDKTLPEKVLREEVDGMIAAGFETTAGMSSFVMLMLATHPEAQDKVYQELCQIYGEDDSEELHVTPEDLSRMRYMERVIKETMRLFPLFPILIRVVKDDLDLGDHILPEGSSVAFGNIDLHRNENYWPNPLKFDPDRFLPGEVAKRHPYAFLPFGGGMRICLGSKYAMMSMKTAVATILRRYVLIKDDIQPIQDVRLKFEIVLKPVHPISLRIQKRITRKNPSI